MVINLIRLNGLIQYRRKKTGIHIKIMTKSRKNWQIIAPGIIFSHAPNKANNRTRNKLVNESANKQISKK